MILGVVNEKALQELGWPRLCGELAGRARTPMGRERCLALLPGDDPAEAQLRLARVEEARVLRRHERELPLADAVDVRPALGRAAREGTLEPLELLQVARLIRASESARRFCGSQADRAPLHYELSLTLSELSPLAQELERAFDPSGKLLDIASPLLAELRERARGLHRAIKQRIEEMLKDEKIVAMLRDTYVSVRGDRYVLPVRAEHKAHLPGIVHNASNSGQTLFVEPQELLELGNLLTIAEAGALEEEQRILAELSGAVGRRAPLLEHDVVTIALLDEAAAGGKLADDLDAGAPELGGERFDLRRARHPLLVLQREAARGAEGPASKDVAPASAGEGTALRAGATRPAAGQGSAAGAPQVPSKIVANDIALPAPASALIVSGPNAGGKTVTITAVGLCALMARAGLPLPALSGSRMPLYRTVYTAIGDEGDLSRDLSTFTAHLSALRWILEAAGPGTLVLIDEIAADTDPREGAAIAVAALEKLVAAGAHVLITTHLEELKALALADPRFAPASVGFDLARLAPTYELRLGEVGASSAIEIARRVGLPEDVCARAREILGKGASVVSQAVALLEQERAESAQARAEVERLRSELENEKGRVERERERLRELEKETRAGARSELIADLAQKRAEVAQLIAQLQAAPAMAAAVEAQKAVERAAAEEEREHARAEEPHPAAGGIEQGARVKHLKFGTEGVVLAIDGDQATVQMGPLKSKVALEDLVPIARRAPQAGFRKSAKEKLERAEQARAAPVEVRVPRVDLRGMRVDEALRTLEMELDRCLRGGEQTVHVLHGHGSGALKAAVREHLQRSPYVSRSRPGESHEGGDGVTVVELTG
ncbi:MAG: endonuclease MutS2 [Myxococcales bacterium]|nr:Smr/MutS family protein [Myxococcales bacterium]